MKAFLQKMGAWLRKMCARISFNAPITLSLAIVSLAFLAVNLLTGGWLNGHITSVYRASAADPLTWVRLFLHPLGHGSWAHYAGNMALLLIVGPPVEEKYGKVRLILMMAVTALLTGLAHIAIDGHSAMLGSSGLVFMLMMVCAVTGPREKGKVPLTLLLACVAYLGQEVASGLGGSDGISQLAHIVGGLCGVGFGLGFAKKKKA